MGALKDKNMLNPKVSITLVKSIDHEPLVCDRIFNTTVHSVSGLGISLVFIGLCK